MSQKKPKLAAKYQTVSRVITPK